MDMETRGGRAASRLALLFVFALASSVKGKVATYGGAFPPVR